MTSFPPPDDDSSSCSSLFFSQVPLERGFEFAPEPSLVVGGFIGAAVLIRYNDERRATLKGQGSSREGNSVRGPIIGGPYTLIDTEHRIVTEKDFKGKWILLYFGYSSSPDVGPEQLNTMAKAINIIESKQNAEILPVFVTIDPQRDTPSHLRAYLEGLQSSIQE
ncbi:hypothetical protein BT93_H3824 [Corymbia citriodora subsp. variegata]|nr:hypothetical protein BT93_H3824 [Corymbia citriodora subsp. variegata]